MAKTAAVTKNKGRPLATLVDELYSKRQERYELQNKAKKMKEAEEALEEEILDTLRKSEATTGIAGKLASAKLVRKEKVVAEDWDAIYKHIKKTGEFDLLQRRLSDEAVKERWEAGEKLPGVNKMQIEDLSLSKV